MLPWECIMYSVTGRQGLTVIYLSEVMDEVDQIEPMPLILSYGIDFNFYFMCTLTSVAVFLHYN